MNHDLLIKNKGKQMEISVRGTSAAFSGIIRDIDDNFVAIDERGKIVYYNINSIEKFYEIISPQSNKPKQ